MNRIDKTLSRLREAKKKMLSPYITAGDPEAGMTVSLMHKLVEAGADVLEVGIPFSDPMAEGPVIQAAMERALAQGVHSDDVLNMVESFRQKDKETPVILMGYLNPVEQYGYEQFTRRAKEAGVDGTILVDLPPEESHDIAPLWEKVDLYSIYLCSPTTTRERMTLINKYAGGYLYYVSLKGVTGASSLDLQAVKKQYKEHQQHTTLPIMVGFGIKTPEMAASVAEFADGVIVGAALIDKMQQAYLDNRDPLEAGATLIKNMRKAIDMN